MTPIQITDLRVQLNTRNASGIRISRRDDRPATESEVLSVLTDEAKAESCSTEKLIGELVKRGVLRTEKGMTIDPLRRYGSRPSVRSTRYVSKWDGGAGVYGETTE